MNAVAPTRRHAVAPASPEFFRDLFVVLLTAGTGATDTIGFTRLGNVFASVMTGNLVLFGLSIPKQDWSVVVHAGLAILAFALGVLFASRFAGHRGENDPVWPPSVTRALTLEMLLALAIVVGWEASGANPTGLLQMVLLIFAAAAMGMQSGSVQGLGVSGLSTTYMTGTLTSLLHTLMVRRRLEARSAFVLSSIIIGAALTELLLQTVPRLAPVLPFALLAAVVVTATARARSGREV